MPSTPAHSLTTGKLLPLPDLARQCVAWRAAGKSVVFTNGCFDVLHAGHIDLLEAARAQGDVLVVGLNSDASVRRLKGAARPLNPEQARARVLGALQAVDALCIFEEDTPDSTIAQLRPAIHVKGGDYVADQLPEAETVRRYGGAICIVPLRPGFSTTKTLTALGHSAAPAAKAAPSEAATAAAACTIVIPARYGSTRFPGKPLALLGGRPVIVHVVEAALASAALRPVLVATDDERIAGAVSAAFDAGLAKPIITSAACHTGTDRLAEVARTLPAHGAARRIIVNVQGDEPFIDARHIDALIAVMNADCTLEMATLATPIEDPVQAADPNVVKVVCDQKGRALYFSRCPIPLHRDHVCHPAGEPPMLRHLGIYAYSHQWLLRFDQLAPTPLEECEKLEQLRALEHGVPIGVAVVSDVVNIAIDTPHDLQLAEAHLAATQLNPR